jgi:lipopolysaccharide export system protein LptA
MHHRRNRIRLFYSVTAFLFYMTGAWALDSDQYAQMHVISDSAIYNRDERTITYEGSVQAEQGSTHVDGDKIVVYKMANSDNQIERIIAYGNPAHYNTLPGPDKARLYVEALKITYDPNQKTVLLEQKAKVTQEGNSFSGPYIWYDTVRGIVHSKATSGKERTEMIIQPQQPPPKK